MKKALYYFGLFCIAIFLFATHSKFLYYLDPGKESKLFIFFGYDLKTYMYYVFGAAFGIVTTIIIALMKRSDRLFWPFAIIVSLLEFAGVFLYNNTEILDNIWNMFAALYYGLYALFLVLMYAYIELDSHRKELDSQQFAPHEKESEKDTNEVELLQKAGKNPKEISELLGIHISTVYRTIKKLENE